ncbi:DUF6308 family protein [Catellatospora vulcania]|uniref:DUF6308 family protein n=1 Tax=Catellatospora vulcania TaxID=1460450 RepID=UPI0012D41EEF|nr:DUF6308 family protein [Catellatospora vulcania]
MDQYTRAREAALKALGGNAATRVTAYYRPDSDYTGHTFLTVGPNDPFRITATDLFAVTLLNAAVGPRATRAVLADEQLTVDLKAVPADVALEHADDETLVLAGVFYERIKQLFVDPTARQSEPWVAPAKLAARKRPELLPVRDALVRRYLGIEPPYSFRTDWDTYRRLMLDPEIRGLLDGLPQLDPPLRLLDVVLWTKARW